MEVGEEETHARFTAMMTEIVHPAIAAHGGRIVKNTGDGFLAIFDSTAAAADCALHIQDRTAGPNCALARGITSFICGYRGDWYCGWEAGHRALRLSPFAPLTSFYEDAIPQAHFIGGDHAAAVEWARHADARNSGFTSNQRVLIAALVATGALEEARAWARRMLEVDPGFRLSAFAARSSLSGRILEDFVALLRMAGLPN